MFVRGGKAEMLTLRRFCGVYNLNKYRLVGAIWVITSLCEKLKNVHRSYKWPFTAIETYTGNFNDSNYLKSKNIQT